MMGPRTTPFVTPMSRLRHSDVTVFSRALQTLYADARAETLPKRVLGTLRGLFACDFASFSLMDLRRRRWHVAVLEPAVREWPGMDRYRRYLNDDPAAVHIMRTRTREALKISDFYSLREYRSSPLYAEMFRPVGCDRRLGIAMQNVGPITLAVTLNRQGRDFREEDRVLLNLLREHLLQANALVQTQRSAEALQLETPERGRETFGVGLIELDASGRTRWLTARAEVLLRSHFSGASRRLAANRLPDALERQVKSRGGSEAAFGLTSLAGVWYHSRPNGRRLKVRLAARAVDGSCQLLLEEEANATEAAGSLSLALGLTAREGEVLHWLAEGLRNWEISQALGNREATVSKHLERVFAKLGVPNRAAAARVVAEARGAR